MKKLRLLIAVLLMLCLATTAFANVSPSVVTAYWIGEYHGEYALYRPMDGFCYGLISQSGAIALQPQWDYAFWITPELLGVYTYDAGFFGVINVKGQYVSDTKWTAISTSLGICQLWQGDVFTLLNDAGKEIVPLSWVSALAPTEDICRLKNQAGQWAYAHVQTGLINDDTYQEARPFVNGFAAVKTAEGWRFLKPDGSLLETPAYASVSDFANETAACQISKQQTVLIDTTGTVLLKDTDVPRDDIPYTPYFDNVLGVYGYRDASGATVIEPRFREAMNFSSELARVNYRGAWGFINPEGKLVISNTFTAAKDFVGWYAYVEDERLQGYIDLTGRLFETYPRIVRPLGLGNLLVMQVGDKEFLADDTLRIISIIGYDRIEPASSTILRVTNPYQNTANPSLVGLINLRGQTIVEPTWHQVGDFEEDRAVVTLNGKCALIDTSGAVLCAYTYDWIDSPHQGIRLAFTGTLDDAGEPLEGNYTFLTKDGLPLNKTKYIDASPFSQGYARVVTAASQSFIDLNGLPAFDNAQWEYVNSFSDGVCAVFAASEWNVINRQGNSTLQ